MTTYTATDVYHYPGGVLAPGQSAELSDDDAARGLASGAIVASSPPAEPEPEPEPDPEPEESS